MATPDKNVICLVIDRLHSGMVGAYGNSWIRTPALNELACQSFLFDEAFVGNPELARAYDAMWLGQHTAAAAQPAGASLPRLLSKAGLYTALLTDERAVAELPLAADFIEHLDVDSPPPDEAADDASKTALAHLFGSATAWLDAAQQPFCLWVHARGMAGAWDAPYAMRQHFAEEDDPDPPTFVLAPDYWLPDRFDPDEVLGIRHAYAGQVAALDMCLGAFCRRLAESPLAGNTQLTLLSARGFPLGEHLRVGPCDEALYNEATQLVWTMRFPDGTGQLDRSRALAQPADLPGTLLDWLGLERGQLAGGQASSLWEVICGSRAALRDRLLMHSGRDRAIRTPAWQLRQPEAGAPELYAKPGDRWEVNEVSRLLPEIVTGLQAALAETEAAGRADSLAPLPEPLVSEVD